MVTTAVLYRREGLALHTGIKRLASRGQMSDAWITLVFLTLSGGFQDAYTYHTRGGVFANAQTGNIVLFSTHLFDGDTSGAITYLAPVCAFAFGVLAAQYIRFRARDRQGFHWRQKVLALEMVLLMGVGFVPQSINAIANVLVSFVCALQVQAFRKVEGNAYASTMCIGNLRSGVETLEVYLRTRERVVLRRALAYFGMLVCFALGAGLGSWLSPLWGIHAVWLCCAWLMISFLLMFAQGENADAM